ncbi:M24 family metallopeptidase [Flavihumibacter petaseus]|uniref:Creatinase N-terminal domain-containing protein n=1 Tax=Flavihumibacter petaseus NBRC 106054 TaxID=1220578 RepID=A0A0E9N0R9_9BACT|nr:M24 family metallopeptidase [Flavihumibacter petaseus]GAO43363.1 hypothetical protein FPE01S_02_04680 [Flavihumibacter petaseus NBRC 106054]
MNNQSSVSLKKVAWPDYGKAMPVIMPGSGEISDRIARCRREMATRGITHLVVYGDREHFANLLYLVHFDPRFEEALLLIDGTNNPLLLVGNECVSHLTVSPLFLAGHLRYERYQPFSLLSQPRDESRQLSDIFREEGIGTGATVGCVGWKYFQQSEFRQPTLAIDLPAFITDELRDLCGRENVVNATDLLMSPVDGLKATCTPFEIAQFEFSNCMASDGMTSFLRNFTTGVTDFEMAKHYQYTGYPLGCHTGLKSSANLHIGLSSPAGGEIRLGDPCSTNISYWGSNICRAGWVASSEADLPESARGYVAEFASLYFLACVQWLQQLRPGARGGDIYELIQELLPFDKFNVFLNPGHLIHFEEWTTSPIYKDSNDTIKSGMYFQLDIIPRSKQFFSSRMEDGYVVADAALQQALADQYPETYARCMARRNFMRDTLGIDMPAEILPLSNTAGLVPPFFLDYQTVFSLK